MVGCKAALCRSVRYDAPDEAEAQKLSLESQEDSETPVLKKIATKLTREPAKSTIGWIYLPKKIHSSRGVSIAPSFDVVVRCRHQFAGSLSMPNITLLYSPTCGACPSAKSLWKELRVKYSFSYREVDIGSPDGQELAERHSIRAVPATIIDGRLTFIGVPSRQSAEKALQLKMQQRSA